LWKVNNTEDIHETLSQIRSTELNVHNFFEFQKIPAGVYEIQVSSSLPQSAYVVPNLKHRMNLVSGTHLKLHFDITTRVTTDEELSNTPIFTLFFGLFVLATIYYFNELVQLAENIASGKLRFPPANNTLQPNPIVPTTQDSSLDWLPKGLKSKHKKK
jgi:hypothetical protein